MDSEDFDVDPSIAEAMGFTGFGNQKKRKFDSHDGFVDPNINKKPQGTGANNLPVRDRPAKASETVKAGNGHVPDRAPGEDSKPSLEALRYGARNQKGDMVYFLPTFLEDPWAGLKSR
ncbi:Hypothetical predicted protein [Lecanosticta acicola]|uniref:Uncharacterized protein n=1 Tax=Lecanosticta acicola TaxID=111012 RepID=A0AAI9EEB5_9PEZI|nr:Hypothetical predicted protein [Lecanosticta acicola]